MKIGEVNISIMIIKKEFIIAGLKGDEEFDYFSNVVPLLAKQL